MAAIAPISRCNMNWSYKRFGSADPTQQKNIKNFLKGIDIH